MARTDYIICEEMLPQWALAMATQDSYTGELPPRGTQRRQAKPFSEATVACAPMETAGSTGVKEARCSATIQESRRCYESWSSR